MTLQDVKPTFLDGALGLAAAAVGNRVLYCGVSSAGTANTIVEVNSTETLNSLGEGPLVEACALKLDISGGPVYAMRVTATTAGSNSTVTASGTSPPAVTIGGAPFDSYLGTVRMTLGGALGTAKFQYSLDNGNTWSPEIVTVASYPIAGTGLTLTFPSGTYALDNTYTWTSTEPSFTTSDLNSALDAANLDSREWGLVYIIGVQPGANDTAKATAAAGIFGAVATKMTSAANNAYKFARAIIEMPKIADSALTTEFAALADSRLSCIATFGTVLSARPHGRQHEVNIGRVAVAKVAGKPIGKDAAQLLAELGTGPLPSALLSLSRDEFKTPGLDSARFVTARTYPGLQGFYITDWHLFSAAGSDYQLLQHGQIMDAAVRAARNVLLLWLSRDLLLNEDGTIDEGQAVTIDESVNNAVRAAVLAERHATRALFRLSRVDDILTTKKLRGGLRVQPKAYPKLIDFDAGFSKRLQAAA